MRLIDIDTRRVEEFIGDSIPKYAILSHTWGREEVTFQDIHRRRATSMAGYQKVEYACKQARRDGLQKVWIDTCCIDKSSSTELSEAINSMFRWYQDAAVCYVYLSDVPSKKGLLLFPFSRWFLRGWTLQELLAPRSLVFYSKDWKCIGTRRSLCNIISEITTIHCNALSGRLHEIREFSIAQKMSWAANRQTTRKEDIAYCLMGLFGVNMPLLYGEGEQAFIRLQEKIMEDSDDQSIFAWQGQYSVVHKFTCKVSGAKATSLTYETGTSTSGPPGVKREANKDSTLMSLLASSPSKFKLCANIVPYRNWRLTETYSMTNAGLKLTARVSKHDKYDDNDLYRLLLRCYDEETPDHWVGIFIKRLSPHGDQYARANEEIFQASEPLFEPTETKTIYVRKQIIVPDSRVVQERGKTNSIFLILKPSPECDIKVTGVCPIDMHDPNYNEGHEIIRLRPPCFTEIVSINYWSWHAVIRLETTHQTRTNSWDLEIVYDGRADRYSFDFHEQNCDDDDLEVLWRRGAENAFHKLTYQSGGSTPEFFWDIRLLDPIHDRDSATQKFLACENDNNTTENMSLSEASIHLHVALDCYPRSLPNQRRKAEMRTTKTKENSITSNSE